MSRFRKSRKNRRSRRSRRRQGGAVELYGAPLNYQLSEPASLAQGADYLKYHEGQHGGAALEGASLHHISHSTLDPSLRSAAHLAGLDRAYEQIAGLSDQAGGRRRQSKKGGKRTKKHGGKRTKKHGGKRHSKRHSKKHGGKSSGKRRHQGGSLGYSPFPSNGMLLSGAQYSQAGLNPEWKNAQEFDSAMARAAL
jgi:hypothetical protein